MSHRFVGMATVIAVLVVSASAWADYFPGKRAWEEGRFAEAVSAWEAAAAEGDARAMLALGRTYVRGLGVPQDYVEAHKWLNLAAGRGNAEAADERDALAAKMTPQQIASAQEQARTWRSGGTVDAPKAVAVPQAPAPSPQAGPPPPRAIKEAQDLMAALGYEPGPADGRWGPRTGEAYAAFLRDAGLPPGNVLTPDALRAMRAADKGRTSAETAASPRQAPATQPKAALPPADLHGLVAAGDIDGLKAALAAGADANARDGKGWTALMYAADKGYALLVPPLLEAGADPNIRASDGATALFMAAVHGHSEIITALTKAGADPSIEGPKGMTAEGLLAARTVQKKYGHRPNALHEALQANESLAVITALLDQGADMTARMQVPNKEYPQYPDFYTPLHTAARYSRRPEVVALLLERGARIEAEVETKYGDDPPEGNGTTAWALAASMNENVDVVMLLIDRAGGLNVRSKYGDTPLHWAASNKTPGVVKLLIDRGANVNAQSEDQRATPLHWAASAEVAKLLIDHEAHIDAATKFGLTPLHLAVGERGNIAVARLLLERGANSEASAPDIATPLHFAATQKNIAAAILLSEVRKDHSTCFELENSVHCGEPVCWAARKENNADMITRLLDLNAEKFPQFYLNAESEASRCMFRTLTRHSPHLENRTAASQWMKRNGVNCDSCGR